VNGEHINCFMIHHSNENVLMDDANSPDINKRLMGMVSEDFIHVADQLKEASYQIRKRSFSEYPVFVASKKTIEIGQLLFGEGDLGNTFTYNASFFDEFVQRELIGEDSYELWKEHYKNPDEYCCLFVVIGEFTGFIYIPYPED
jgi:methionine salvage enolase-phosphatase E1